MNARDVIARAVAIARGDDPHYAPSQARLTREDRDTAELGVRRIVAAGFRILGPDEVDALREDTQVAINSMTGECEASHRIALNHMERALRALGRKA